jgi:hypothetical protein
MTRTSWLAAALAAATFALPHSTLAVKRGGSWRVWWDARTAPARWQPADTARLGAIEWRAGVEGVEWSEIVLAGSGEAWRTRVIVARLDPRRVRFRLDTSFARDGKPTWSVERARPAALFAVNAGQFLHTMPWGEVVLDGMQWMTPGIGPLSSTVEINARGAVSLRHGNGAAPGGTAWAFQSYPTLLRAGEVPAELRDEAPGINLEHRDARAAIGVAHDGRVIVALTRFDALGSTLGFVPFGLTTPEMAAVMGALGARDAVMLDGGISGQMMVRGAGGIVKSWRGTRSVPLALVGY